MGRNCGPARGVIALLRLRYKLTIHGRRERLLLAEEAGALAFEGAGLHPVVSGEPARALLEHPATGDLAVVACQQRSEIG